MNRPPPPEFVTEWERVCKSPPKSCHTCINYDQQGICEIYEQAPPDDFIHKQGECESWMQDVPF